MKTRVAPAYFIIAGLALAGVGAQSCSKNSNSGATQGPAASQGAGASQQAASGGLPAQTLPRGYQAYSDAQSSGRLIYAKFSQSDHSARSAMRDSLSSLNSYFDAPPQLLSAVSDSQDQVVQAVLSANLKGQPVRGVATVVIGSAGATFGLVFDRPTALQNSFQTLSKRLGQEMPQSSGASGPLNLSAPQDWKRQAGGDGSAAVNLPAGWRITGTTQGIVSVEGPHKEYVELGLIFFVATQALPGAKGMVSRYLDPVPAFTYFVNYNSTVKAQDGSTIHQSPGRVLESKAVPAPMQGGKGAYLLQEITVNGVPYKLYGLVYTAPMVMSGWTFYTSYVAAPASVFDAEFADMMRMWASWKVDDRVYQQLMQQTMESMNATRDILQGSQERQMHAYDNLEENMDLIIKGEDRVGNSTLGTSSDVSTQNTASVLASCKARGYDCKEVPFDQLTGHQ